MVHHLAVLALHFVYEQLIIYDNYDLALTFGNRYAALGIETEWHTQAWAVSTERV